MKNTKKNRGFSLVELIVVVAIMAVLVGVLAPSLLRYVEKSRYQKDASAVAEVENAIPIIAAEETFALADGTYTVVMTGSGAYDTTSTMAAAFLTELGNTVTAPTFTSTTIGSSAVTSTVTVSSGNITITNDLPAAP